MTLAAFLRDMFPPEPAKPAPAPERPAGHPSTWQGIFYRDGNIPH